jgi:hypothetical protein
MWRWKSRDLKEEEASDLAVAVLAIVVLTVSLTYLLVSL